MNQNLEFMKGMINILNYASEMYYNTDTPIMTDKQFDDRLEDLKHLEKETGIVLSNSPTINVGAKVLTELKEVKHNHPMLSLEKVHSIDEILKFINNKDIIASVKLDGLSISILYENGNLIRAETRGDGNVGSDVTEHIKHFLNVPLTIKKMGRYVIDGEAIIKDDDFKKVNENLLYIEETPLKNSRNAASGSLSVLDTSIVKKRKLSFFAWDVIDGGESNLISDNLFEAKMLGFDVVPYFRVSRHSEKMYEKVIDTVFSVATEDGFPCDGVVLKFDDIAYGKTLGKTGHHFKNGIAYKKLDQDVETTIIDIEWQMGKTGVLSPVAVFEPVEIDGSTIERASVHNVSILTKLNLHIGDKITVYKSNLVIPQIRENLSKNNSYIYIPSKCPVCGGITKIVNTKGTNTLMCTNYHCKGKLLGRLNHFVSKQAMNIDGLSEATLARFIDEGFVQDFVDIYELKSQFYEDVIKLNGFGKKSVDKIIESIEKSRHTTLDRFINALSIPNVGKETARLIAEHCKYDFDIFINKYNAFNVDVVNNNGIIANIIAYDWTLIEGVGNVVSDNINMYLLNNRDMIIELSRYLTFIKPIVTFDTVLDNKTFCITGALNHFANRDELKKRIESLGGKVVNSVSSKTDYLINNDSASNSSKNKKAKELGVSIITEKEFLDMLGD